MGNSWSWQPDTIRHRIAVFQNELTQRMATPLNTMNGAQRKKNTQRINACRSAIKRWERRLAIIAEQNKETPL